MRSALCFNFTTHCSPCLVTAGAVTSLPHVSERIVCVQIGTIAQAEVPRRVIKAVSPVGIKKRKAAAAAEKLAVEAGAHVPG